MVRRRCVTRGERATAIPAHLQRASLYSKLVRFFSSFSTKRSDSVEEIKRGALPISDLSLNPAVVNRVH